MQVYKVTPLLVVLVLILINFYFKNTICLRLLAEKQRLISQAEEDHKSKTGFVSQQTYGERQLSRASESSEEEQSIKTLESSEERRPLISPKPNDIRRHLASPTHFEEGKQLFKMSDMTRNYCSPTPRSLSEFTKEDSQQVIHCP